MRLTPIEKNMIIAYRKACSFNKILVERFFRDCLYSDIGNTNELRTNKGIFRKMKQEWSKDNSNIWA